jgi:hypothetical protein
MVLDEKSQDAYEEYLKNRTITGIHPEPTVKIWCELRSRGPPVVGVEIKGNDESDVIKRVLESMVTMTEKTKNWISKEA